MTAGVEVKAAGKAFVAATSQGKVNFKPGAMLIPMGLQQPQDITQLLQQLTQNSQVKVWSLTSGLTSQGIDLGSNNMQSIDPVRVLLVGGKGTSQYEVGEMWHYLDTQIGMPASIVDMQRLAGLDLDKYSHVIFASGNYKQLSDKTVAKLSDWVRRGGVVIGQRHASRWLTKVDLLATIFTAKEDINRAFDTSNLKYAERDALAGKKRIAGAVFKAKLDNSHPLAFGLSGQTLPMFRNSDLVMKAPDKPFLTVAQYQSKPLVAGYTSPELQKLIANSAAMVAHSYGRGAVIAFTDDLNFRGYWQGTNRLLSNSIFLSGFIDEEG